MKTRYKILILLAAGILLVAASLMIGTKFISPSDMMNILLGGRGVDYIILIKLRIPRVALALIVGASLGVSGSVFQSVLKNPLADPYIIGVSGGAALGATIAIVLGAVPYAVAAASFIGSIAAISGVYALSRRMRLGSSALILSGIALGFILYSAVLLMYAVSRSDQIHRALLWLMGDLSGARYEVMGGLGVIALALSACILAFHKHLDVISLGDRFSKNLGVSPADLRILFWSAALLAAISVALAGVIGFVGLIVPHLMRNLFGSRHLRLLPASAAGGAAFLMLSDAIGRTLAPPYEIPVGVITGFLGGLFFLVHMLRREAGA